jgi:UDP-N-acetylmuramyl pentapeptide phosphotransferase/UDP-N-acetylglucosamine-1-phosphate transferase
MFEEAGIIEPVRLVLVSAVGFFASVTGTHFLIRYLAGRQILDRPNERSSHDVPTPRGGGIAVVGAVAAAWLTGLGFADGPVAPDLVILAAAILLGAVCFLDDLRGLGPLPRLLAQIAAVAPGLWLVSGQGGLFHAFLPPLVDLAATGFLWLWFINLFNFMDGIDGISGVEISAIGIGLAGLAAAGSVGARLLDPALALTAAALGFLVWNWRPARIFMGDVGSIPIGYLIGWLLISAASGPGGTATALAACLVLPAYYLADATITLVRRLSRGENVFQAHRQHYYQQAVIRGVGHAVICGWVITADAGLIATAWFVVPTHPVWGIVLAAMIVAALLGWMAGVWNNPGKQPEPN